MAGNRYYNNGYAVYQIELLSHVIVRNICNWLNYNHRLQLSVRTLVILNEHKHILISSNNILGSNKLIDSKYCYI